MTVALGPEVLKAFPLPPVEGASGKDERGRVLVVGSSASVPGAALLSGEAALRAGAGKLQMAVAHRLATAIGVAFPESGILRLPETAEGEPAPEAGAVLCKAAQHVDAVLIGPGLIDQNACRAVIGSLLSTVQSRYVLDAGALVSATSMGRLTLNQRSSVILTPHTGEMATMLGVTKDKVEADPEGVAKTVAAELRVVVALKGATTYIANPDGQVWRNDRGAAGLGTCGSGDILSGIIVGLLARGALATTAALWGVYVHARIGETLSARVGTLGFLAREILSEIPKTLDALQPPQGGNDAQSP